VLHPDKEVIKKEIIHSQVKAAGLGTGILEKSSLIIESLDGKRNNFGTIKSEDADFVLNLLK
jgi:hypothetical protein